MTAIPKKVEERIKKEIKKYKRILKRAKDRDVNEFDTVTIITDALSDICGYDKYSEITREYAIRGTYCDLAVKIDDKLVFLIEVKAIGISLKEAHLRQAINYAAHQGIEWVILTNGDHWQAHRVLFKKPIKTEVAFDFCFIETRKSAELLEFFYLLSKEGAKKSAIDVFHEEAQLSSRHMIAAAIQTDAVVTAIRRQLRNVNKKVKISDENILNTIQEQVLKREVINGDEPAQAKKRLTAALRAKARKAKI